MGSVALKGVKLEEDLGTAQIKAIWDKHASHGAVRRGHRLGYCLGLLF